MIVMAPSIASADFRVSRATLTVLEIVFGIALVADGMHFRIPRGSVYFAVAFSLSVEALNLFDAHRKAAAPARRSGEG